MAPFHFSRRGPEIPGLCDLPQDRCYSKSTHQTNRNAQKMFSPHAVSRAFMLNVKRAEELIRPVGKMRISRLTSSWQQPHLPP